MKIAFLVLTFDEVGITDYLSWVISGIKRQIIDADIDVLFVDNLSSDNFRDEIKKECDENNWECISVSQPRYPIQVCKNIGWKWFARNGVKYDYYVFSSDDIVMDHPDNLQTIIKSFNPEHGAVTPYVLFDPAPLKQQRRVAEQHYNARTDIDEMSHSLWAYAHFMVYPNEFFEKFNYREIDIMWNIGFSPLLVYLCKSVGMKWKWCCRVRLYNARKGSTKHHKRHDRRPTNTGTADALHISPYPYPECQTSYVYFDNKEAPNFDSVRNAACFDAVFSEGTKVGLGWYRIEDGSSPIKYEPDMSNYDSSGKHKYPKKLHEYIMKHLFLSSEALNYEEIIKSACIVRTKEDASLTSDIEDVNINLNYDMRTN